MIISVTEAKPDKLFYVVANLIIVDRQNQTVLLLKRSPNEKVLPGKWAFPGGKLEHGEVDELLTQKGTPAIEGVENILGVLAAREAQEECGLEVDPNSLQILSNKVFVRPDNVPVFMVTMSTDYSLGKVVVEEGAFTDFAWVNSEQLDAYDTIKGIKEEARLALA